MAAKNKMKVIGGYFVSGLKVLVLLILVYVIAAIIAVPLFLTGVVAGGLLGMVVSFLLILPLTLIILGWVFESFYRG